MRPKPTSRHIVKPLILTALLLIALTSLFPRTYHIKQDGTGDFATITAGIDAAVSGDTLLVYPGRYVENIRYNGKNITITSLYGVESNDRRYIRETIIDGNQNGAVVVFINGETRNAVLNGFTITNGSGYYRSGALRTSQGGGLYIVNASPIISNCIVEYNYAFSGGGLWSSSGNSLLAGNTIRHNRALDNYGGICSSGAEFCNELLNSVYFNYSSTRGSDLYLGGRNQRPVIIDTLTVRNPDIYFVEAYIVPDDFSLTVLNGKIEPVAADLYVSADGCNTNDGLTRYTPLQTIAFAMSKIDPIGTERRNIFVADGLYSASQSNQIFPVQVRSNVNITGESKENTILDMEYRAWAFSASVIAGETSGPNQKYLSDFSIKNFTIKNGGNDEFRYTLIYSGMRLHSLKDFEIENIAIQDGIAEINGPIWSYYITNFEMRNIEITNCIGGTGILFGIGGGGTSDTLFYNIENLRINNFSYPTSPPREKYGISLRFNIVSNVEIPVEGTITNLEITDGVIGRIDHFWGQYPYSHFMYLNDATESPPHKLKIVNATIGNNSAPGRAAGGGIFFNGGVDAEIINSIIYRNTPANITLLNPRNHQMDFTISHSILTGGLQGILYQDNVNVNWDDSNIDADPVWIGENDHGIPPYMIHELSPARGAGTLDIPDFTFPEFDLAGNPRVVDGRIDMGAYQWHPPTSVEERDGVTKGLREGEFNLRNFPNPAVTLMSRAGVEGHRSSTTGTNIAFELPEAGNVMIEIYNLKGQFVKRVFDAYIPQGEYNVFWDGKNERGRYVATGFYMYHLKFNEQLVATGRATFIK